MQKDDGYDAGVHTQGLFCSVYRSPKDGSNRGITSKVDEVLLVGPGVRGPFAASEGDTVLYLHWWDVGGERRYFASPESRHSMRYMFGGNFIYSCDSRFPSRQPIPVHDRRE